MSVWGDIRIRVNGDSVRKEDESSIVIEDKEGLLTASERTLFNKSLTLNFNLGVYKSLENILAEPNPPVRIIIDPREPLYKDVKQIPSELVEAKNFWEEKVRKNPNDEYARRMLGEVKEEIGKWKSRLIRGLYNPAEKIIVLFPNNMKKEYGGTKMQELLLTTLVHEVMHAYFDRIPLNVFPYIYSLEEPMAEFGMLLYLKETNQTDYYDWAKGDVGIKKSCYRYGVALMEQCEREGIPSQIRRDLELYKVIFPTFSLIKTSTVSATMTKRSGKVSRLYHINGKGIYSMSEVIEEYIKFKLDAGTPFKSISPIKGKFISVYPNGVSIGSRPDAKPYSFNYKGKDYYITTQLKDGKPIYNFWKFRTMVSSTDPGFIITPI